VRSAGAIIVRYVASRHMQHSCVAVWLRQQRAGVSAARRARQRRGTGRPRRFACCSSAHGAGDSVVPHQAQGQELASSSAPSDRSTAQGSADGRFWFAGAGKLRYHRLVGVVRASGRTSKGFTSSLEPSAAIQTMARSRMRRATSRRRHGLDYASRHCCHLFRFGGKFARV
jgi:hypothetical protein